jgi:hypothetical protein
MIRIKGRGVVYGEIWYDEELPRHPGVDIVLYRQREVPIPNARTTPFLTMVTDLSVTEGAITEKFGKDCRYKIRRAETRDELRMEFITDPEDMVDEFRAFFNAFAKEKSFWPCDHQWLLAACKARQLVLTSVSRNGETLVWHAYLTSGKTAWLQYTGSCFRNKENDYRALVGRANRWLHWKGMLRFKETGVERYDWGGLFEDESVPENAGINRFKKDFGGQQVRTYDCTLPVTLKGRIWLPLREAWRRRNSVRPAVVTSGCLNSSAKDDPVFRSQGHLAHTSAVVDSRVLGPGEPPQSRLDFDRPARGRGVDEHGAVLKVPAPDSLAPRGGRRP